MTVRIAFPQPAARMSMNDRKSWRAQIEPKLKWKQAAFYGCFKAIGYNANLGPSFVRVTFPVKDNRRRDSDNPAPTCKAIVDALVMAGCWPDDSTEWVETLGSRFAKGATEVVVEIIPRTEAAA